MSGHATPQATAGDAEYYEVRDLLSGELIGYLSAERVRADGALRRALEHHGFRLVAVRDRAQAEPVRLADAA